MNDYIDNKKFILIFYIFYMKGYKIILPSIAIIILVNIFSGCITDDVNISLQPEIADSDNDGVQDNYDHCPDIPGSIYNNGCPEEQAQTPTMSPSTQAPTTVAPTSISPPTTAPTTQPTSTSPAVVISLETTDWPMEAYDISRSGITSSTGVATYASLWATQRQDSFSSSPIVAYGKVYVGTEDGYLICYDKLTGNEIWNYKTSARILSTPTIYREKVYFGSYDGYAYCLDAYTGDYVWSHNTGAIRGAPLVHNNMAYITSFDQNIYCISSEDGVVLWSYLADGLILGGAAYADGYVFFGDDTGTMYSLNHMDGSLNWKNFIDSAGSIYSNPCVTDDSVYFGSTNHDVYRLNKDDGTVVWKMSTKYPVRSSPIYYNNSVYVGAEDKFFYCINSADGSVRWLKMCDSGISASPSISNNKVYFMSLEGNLYCLDAGNGSEQWVYTAQFGPDGWSSSSIAISESYAYFSAYSLLYCIG